MKGLLFLECDAGGQILWMNEKARARLGPVGNLFENLAPEWRPEARHFLAAQHSSRRTFKGYLHRAELRERVAVEFSRIFGMPGKVLLQAQVWERTSDKPAAAMAELETLVGIESRTVRNYFRLQRAQETLESRRASRARHVGRLLSEQLERERARLGRELHSGAGQALAGIRLQLELLATQLPEAPAPARATLERTSALTQQALDQLRAISQRLYGPDWQRLALRDALERLWKIMGIPQKFQATLELEILAAEPPQPVRAALYRVVQEGLSNVIRHAEARRLRLALGVENDRIRLVLEDDGRGFDPEQLPAASGIGLRSIADQVGPLDGTFQIESGPKGTRLTVLLPLTEADE